MSGLVLNNYRYAVFFDGEAVGVFVEIEAFRSFCLFQRVLAVLKVVEPVHTVRKLFHNSDQRIAGVNLKDRSGQMMVGIILVHLGELHITPNECIGDFNFNNCSVHIDLYRIRSLIQHIAFRGHDFSDHILAVRYVLEGEAAVVRRDGCQDGFLAGRGK